jgi:sulfite exporter TauE/SafE
MVWTALVLGVVGSLHCAGMCSPLLAAVSGQNPFAITKVIYNSARILAYGSMGMVAATVGSVAGLSGYQFYLSVGLGALLLFAGIGQWHLSAPFLQRPFQFFSNRLKSVFNKFLKQQTWYSKV